MIKLPAITSTDAARQLLANGLANAELDFLMSLTAPLFWVNQNGEKHEIHNGSAFFLNTGENLFAVTACHVIDQFRRNQAAGTAGPLCLGNELLIDLDGEHRLIASHRGIDIATFAITREEVTTIGKTVLTGCQKEWPPKPPEEQKGVLFGGFAGVETRRVSTATLSFGKVAGYGVATSVSPTDVSSQIERDRLTPVFGDGIPPEDYHFGGLSGGPMLTVIETDHYRGWTLAGVVYQGPNSSTTSDSSDEGCNSSSDPTSAIRGLEVIRARRAHYILPDGTLDTFLWL